MKLNEAGKTLVKSFEGLKLTAYKCSANKDTIGYGNTFYEDGTPVKPGDKITKERAESLFELIASEFEAKVRPLIKANLTENQYSALVSFAYNAGIGTPRTHRKGPSGLWGSTLLAKVNANPNDPSIRAEFMKWNKAGGKVLNGLTRRRQAEADLYFKP